MKERRDVAMLKESAKNSDVNGSGGLRDIKEEVKEEVKGRSARSTPDTKPPSNKMANGEAGVKEENGGPMSVGSDMKKSPAGAGTMGSGPQSGLSGPLQSESMPGFIQQQSRIFVFSTQMANKAAEAVKHGHFKSMIAFHMEQPTTKQYLQMNPVKPGQYGRPATSMPTYSQYPGNPPMMGKPGMAPGPGPNYMPGMGPEGCPGGPSVGGSVAQWVQQQNANLQEQQAMGGMPPYSMNSGAMGPGPRPMSWNPQGMMQGPGGPMGGPPGPGYPMMDSSFEFNPDAVGPGGSVSMPHMNLSQNKVPNENLTPEQLERREEQLASLRKLGQMLFAGDQNPMESGPRGMYMGGNMNQQQQQAMMSQQQAMMSQHQAMMGGPGPGPHPGMMSPSQQYMMQQQQQSMGMAGPGGPFPPGHPAGPRMAGPPSSMGQDINPAQHAWMQMQQEFYEKKSQQMLQHRSQQAMMGGMAPGPGPQHPMERGPMNGPPPPYYSTMSGKRQPGPMGMVGSPTSPNPMMDPGDPLGMFPSARSRPGMPMDPQGMDGMGPGFVPGPSPGPMPGPGMPPHSMGGMGMGVPSIDQMIPGMGPGPAPGPTGPQGPMSAGRTGPGGMMGGGSGVNVVSSTSGRKNAGQVTLHRAGNPEQFTPDPNSASLNTPGSKPPPSYAQAQKRKREDLEDAYKHLQPTPSPTQLNYLNQFEGQELTITKQLNSAFRDPTPGGGSGGGGGGGVTPHDPPSVPPSSHPHNTQFSSPASNSNPVNSPLTHGSNAGGNPPSVKGPMSNSSQTSSTGHLGSPGSLHHGPGPSPMSGANMRLTHFDPPHSGNGSAGSGAGNTPGGGSMSSAPATPTAGKPPSCMPTSSSSSMSNITSASLANLAKGVEHLSNQMQQNMMQGGPFHSIQVQGQMSGSGSNSNSSNGGGGGNVRPASNPPSQTQSLPVTCQSAGSQPVNNTYLSTNLQIGQVNIQNVTAGSNASMQVQQMTSESPHMSMAGGPGSMLPGGPMTSASTANGSMGGAGGMPPHMSQHVQQQQQQQQQQQAVMMSGGPGGMQGGSMGMSQTQHMQSNSAPPGGTSMAPGMPPSSQVKSPPYSSHQPVPHPLPHPSMSTGMHQTTMGTSMPGAGNRLASPPFPPSSVGNANVQIQPKAPNTIQYLPANPPPTQQPPQPAMGGGPPPAKRPAPDMEFMPRYSSPMDMKNPSSTLQYFPGSPNHAMRHPSTSVGPGPTGPMSEFSPQQTMEMQQAMMMRGGGPTGPSPQDYGPMGPMGQGMHPGMSMGPGGPVPPSAMHSPPMGMEGGMRGMEMGGGMSGMGSPMDPMMMGPGPSAMRQMSALGPGGPNSMDPMSPMSSMMGPAGGPPSGPYPGGAPSGYMPNGQTMMMSQSMQGPGPGAPPGHHASMGGMPMPHGGMARMPGGPPSMRMPMQGAPGPAPGPGSSGGYSAQYQQFQQQLYSQGRSRQLSPMHMMGGPPGPGQPYMGMMPNMPPS